MNGINIKSMEAIRAKIREERKPSESALERLAAVTLAAFDLMLTEMIEEAREEQKLYAQGGGTKK